MNHLLDLGRSRERIRAVNRREFLLSAGAVVGALAATPAALARRLGGTPTALVTADVEAHVAAVDLSSGRVVRRIPTLEGPRAVESIRQTLAVVAHTSEGAVSILDGAHLRVQKVLRSFSEPRYVTPHPTGRYAYVTDSGSGEVVTLDLLRARVVHRAEVGGPARHISIDRDGRFVWSALGSRAEGVAVVDVRDPARPRLVETIRPPYLAHDVVFAPNGTRAWITGGAVGTIGVYDVARRELRFRIRADAAPQHITFGEGVAYVASGDDGTLRIHGLRGGRLLATARVPVGSYNLTGIFGLGLRGRVFTPSLSQGTLTVLDADGRVLRETQVAAAAHDAAFVVSA